MNAQPYLDRMTQAMRLKHLSLKTEECYLGWSRRFAAWLPLQKRHAWATHAHRRGASLRDIQEHLGHTHLNTTMIYITPDPTPIASPYEALGIEV